MRNEMNDATAGPVERLAAEFGRAIDGCPNVSPGDIMPACVCVLTDTLRDIVSESAREDAITRIDRALPTLMASAMSDAASRDGAEPRRLH